jgi:hypothetical protein
VDCEGFAGGRGQGLRAANQHAREAYSLQMVAPNEEGVCVTLRNVLGIRVFKNYQGKRDDFVLTDDRTISGSKLVYVFHR